MSPKYRHRGYRDSEREERDRPKAPVNNLTPEERIQRRSLRHAIDREANEILRCHNCGRTLQNLGTITEKTACPHCNAALHCCRTCRHFDTAARHQCRAEIVEPVGDKNKANRCPEYQARLVLDVTGRRSGTPKSNDPRSAFENLFKR